MLELPLVLWTVFWRSRGIIQTVGKNLDQKYFFILVRKHFEKYFQKMYSQKCSPKNQNFWKSEILKIFEILENFRNFEILKKIKILIFWKFSIFIFLCEHFWEKNRKIFFEMLSHQDEKIFLVQIFFYCLDYASRPLKNCSEYSGKFKHASAVDSVS